MERSPARSLVNGVAAAAAYVAFWGALIALPGGEPGRRVVAAAPVAPVSAHGAGAVAWAAGAVPHHVYEVVDRRARALAPAQRTRVARAILEETARTAMDPLLVLAVIQVESAFDPAAMSGAGAVGLMQLLLPTMREEVRRSRLGSADPLDPVANVRAGIRYLDRLLAAFDDVELALMAYNAGPNRIRRYLRAGGIPERFLGYPRSVVKALRRHAVAADALARGVPERLCVAHAAPRGEPAAVAVSGSRVAALGDVRLGPPARSAPPTLLALAAPGARVSTGWRVPSGDDDELADDGLGTGWLGEDEGPGPPPS
jgi:hypothetical protein